MKPKSPFTFQRSTDNKGTTEINFVTNKEFNKLPMTQREFNEKWKPYIEEGFTGMEFDHPVVTNYLDRVFTEEIKTNKDFQISQIKVKFGYICVYCNSLNRFEWEGDLNKMLSL